MDFLDSPRIGRLSRMMLGTVQFGMPYGIANRTGQPEFSDVIEIMAAAVDSGVNCFDTASLYGTSEEVLGRALKTLRTVDCIVVVTKVRALSDEELRDPRAAARAIEASVAQSRMRLQMDQLPLVLFHREADAVFLDTLHQLIDRGWIKNIGVSCNNFPGPALEFARNPLVAALQIPANLADRRHPDSGVFDEALRNQVAVFIRSAFLQGLLLMPESEVPASLQEILPVRRHFETLAADAGMKLPELAVRYLLSLDGVTCILTGVETVAHVHENVRLFDSGRLPDDLFRAVHGFRPELPEMIITPAQWPATGR